MIGAIGVGAYRAGRSLHDSSLVDRLVRGRIWIGLLGFLLIGLVALNVSLLKLNAQAGRNAEAAKALRIKNDRLAAKAARLASGDRMKAAGARLGLVMPEAGKVRYLKVGTADARHAAKNIRIGQRDYTPPAPTTAAPTDAATGTGTTAPATGTTGAPPATTETPATATQPPPAATTPAPDTATPGGVAGQPTGAG